MSLPAPRLEEPMLAGHEPEPCHEFQFTFDDTEMFGGLFHAGNGLVADVEKQAGRWTINCLWLQTHHQRSSKWVVVGLRPLEKVLDVEIAGAIDTLLRRWVEQPEGQSTLQHAADAEDERRANDPYEEEPEGRE